MARDMPGKKVKRPAQGVNSTPTKPGPWRVRLDAANATPKVVSLGKLSKPTKRGKWSPKGDPNPRTIQD